MDKERIIKIKGNRDSWYEEATFIVRNEIVTSLSYQDLQQRADTIIGNYAKTKGLQAQVKSEPKTASTDAALNLILASSIGILIICLYLL